MDPCSRCALVAGNGQFFTGTLITVFSLGPRASRPQTWRELNYGPLLALRARGGRDARGPSKGLSQSRQHHDNFELRRINSYKPATAPRTSPVASSQGAAPNQRSSSHPIPHILATETNRVMAAA